MRYWVLILVLLTMLIGSLGAHAFSEWQPEGESYAILEEAIVELEQDVERAMRSRAASLDFFGGSRDPSCPAVCRAGPTAGW